jgi:hypothetical protein
MNRTLLVTLSAAMAAALLSAPARAGVTYEFQWWGPVTIYDYDGDPAFAPVRRFYRSVGLAPDNEMTPEEFDRTHASDFDESYYVPKYDPSATPGKVLDPSATLAPPPPVIRKTGSAATRVATAPSQQVATPKPALAPSTAHTAGPITCEKATSIVAGYGFKSVKPASCVGRVYAFNAIRDGADYTVRLDAASGELTEVKKVK